MKPVIPFVLLAISVSFVCSKYTYIPNTLPPSSAIVFQAGNTGFDDLAAQCDAMGIECAGFDTYGNLYNSVASQTPTVSFSLFVKTGGSPPPPLPKLVPLPQKYSFGTTTIAVSAPFTFYANQQSDILSKAMSRYNDLIFINGNVTVNQGLASCSIVVASANDTLQLGIDDSYSLVVSPTDCVIKANTIYGAMYGLETLSQLIGYNFDAGNYQIKNGPVDINDYAQFPHRGVLVDVSRHFIPIVELKRVIDSLSYAKLNVLHLHLSDCQSFPFESKTYPNLWNGSYSPRERYTQWQIIDLVQYAKERGVRVMPEMDGPGHMYAWGVGYPELLPDNYMQSTNCYNICPNNPCDVPIDPTQNLTYALLDGLLGEMTGGQPRSGIFWDDFFHLGGDEVEYGCWNESAEIQEFMAANNLQNYDELYMYFVQKYHNIAVSYGRVPVNWEEVFNHFYTKLAKDTVIHVWLDHATLVNVTESGYRGILSNSDWYLDHLNTDWTVYFVNDPLQGITTTAAQNLVLGGEVCMWGETVDISDQLARIWPKAAAAAERLWSYYTPQMQGAIELAIPRLHDFRCRLAERGIPTAPLYSPYPNAPSSCFDS